VLSFGGWNSFVVEEVSMIPICTAAEYEPMVFAMPGRRECAKRIMAMMALWTVFGVIVGSNLLGGNLIGIISGAIAGAIVLPWLGVMLSVFGGPARDSLLGAATGCLTAVVYGTIHGGSFSFFTFNFCLIVGGMMGANLAFFLAIRNRWRGVRLAVSR
jgi:hypothetical protein